MKRRIIVAVLLISIPLIFAAILTAAGGIAFLETRSEGARYRLSNPGHDFSDAVVVLDVDDNTLATYASENDVLGKWPWPRDIYYPILEHLTAMGVRGVMMDIMFIGASRDEYDPEGNLFNRDEDLAAANLDFPLISHALYAQQRNDIDGGGFAVPEDVYQFIQPHSFPVEVNAGDGAVTEYNVLDFPTGLIHETAGAMHCVTVHQDSIGVLSQQPAFCKYGSENYLSLAVLASTLPAGPESIVLNDKSLSIKTLDGREYTHPVRAGDQLPLHFYTYEDTYGIPRIPASNLIEDIRRLQSTDPEEMITSFADLQVQPEMLMDKVVIFGASAKGAYDRLMTPYGELPGVLMHATLLSNILSGHSATRLPPWSGIVITAVLISIIVIVAIFGNRLVPAIVVPIALTLGYMLLAGILFRNDIIIPTTEVLLIAPLTFMASLAYLILIEGAEKRKYRQVLGNMVDPTIVSEAIKDLEALKRGGEKEITAFFSDVASFSTISEQLSAADLAALLNEYLSAMTQILKAQQGTLDKYIGDAIVGIFGAPLEQEQHSIAAARASLEMMRKLEELRHYWQANQLYSSDAQQMQVRIGLNTGRAKVGFMGTEELASYTMMGDTVNLAARLEAAAKDYGVHILISESTRQEIHQALFTRILDMIVVKGKTEPVRVYELVGEHGKVAPNIADACHTFERAFQSYLHRDWNRAMEQLRESVRIRGQADRAAELLIERCQIFQSNPPAADWQGAFVRTHK